MYHRMNDMRDEIDQLKHEMRSNELVDRELLREINEFNKMVSFKFSFYFFRRRHKRVEEN